MLLSSVFRGFPPVCVSSRQATATYLEGEKKAHPSHLTCWISGQISAFPLTLAKENWEKAVLWGSAVAAGLDRQCWWQTGLQTRAAVDQLTLMDINRNQFFFKLSQTLCCTLKRDWSTGILAKFKTMLGKNLLREPSWSHFLLVKPLHLSHTRATMWGWRFQTWLKSIHFPTLESSCKFLEKHLAVMHAPQF